MAEPPHVSRLKRVIGPRMLLLFMVGDILGTGIYALIGTVVGTVGGLAWLPFLIAFVIAAVTALSYAELATRYPQAAGAALYVHHAFNRNLLTFLIGFSVLCGGVTTAAAGAVAFSTFVRDALGRSAVGVPVLVSIAFLLVLTAVNLVGIGESLALNVVLTCVELAGLLVVIGVGVFALANDRGSWDNVLVFESVADRNVMVALTMGTSLAFFAMIGFEDAVNLVEETRDPLRHFPPMMLGAIGLTGVIYTLVAAIAVSLVPIGRLSDPSGPAVLTQVMAAAVPGLPLGRIFALVAVCAVANTALLNLVAASRLLYGMARQGVIPAVFGGVHPRRRTPWAAGITVSALSGLVLLIVFVTRREASLAVLGGTASLLVLCVFAVVNIALIVLRRRAHEAEHFHAPAPTPWVGAALCAILIGPWARTVEQYVVAGFLLAIGWLLYRFPAGMRVTEPGDGPRGLDP